MTQLNIKEMVGTVQTSLKCGKYLIEFYESSKKVHIKFLATDYATIIQSSLIKDGTIRDPLYPTVYGVGFLGEGKYSYNKHKAASKKWRAMLERCYSEVSLKKHPTYRKCTVCKEWHNFQNFAKWFEEMAIDGYHLDKDLKVKGNTVYAPELCSFLTQADNNRAHLLNPK